MAEDRTKRKLAAILAADVVGYARLVRGDEEGTLARLKALRKGLIDPKIAEHGGRVVKLMGDGMLAEFASVVDAVACAAAVQRAVPERNAGVKEDERIEFRVGINLGDVVIDGDDIQGDGVNLAARLEGMAPPGGMCISGAVHEQVRHRLGLEFEDLGEQTVKNIADPVRVWRWATAGGAAAEGLAKPGTPLPLPDKPSIAVLPFDNMSEDQQYAHFADGLAEDIITTLSKISSLFVIARNSTFVYKQRAADVRQVARELGVRYVLEGSVRAAGRRLRITAQLIDAVDGGHLWAERYDRQLDDVFEVQDEIMREIVTALRVKLSDGEQARIWLRGTDSVEAWSCAMQGVELALRGAANSTAEARRLFERAIAIDPDYAMAHGWIAFTHRMDAHFGFTDDPRRSYALAGVAADRACGLDPNLPMGLAVTGGLAIWDGRHQEGLELCRRAAAFSPGDVIIKIALARNLVNVGRLEEAETALREAMRLNPFCPVYYYGIFANALEQQDRFDEAIGVLEAALSRNADYFSGHLRLASVLGLMGRTAAAAEHAAEAMRINPRFQRESLPFYYGSNDEAALQRFVAGLKAAGLDLT